jgi:hypothetical protein
LNFFTVVSPGRLFQISTSRAAGQIGSQLRQRDFAREAFGVGDGFGFFRRGVDGDVVRFVFDREVFHFQSPGAAVAAIST